MKVWFNSIEILRHKPPLLVKIVFVVLIAVLSLILIRTLVKHIKIWHKYSQLPKKSSVDLNDLAGLLDIERGSIDETLAGCINRYARKSEDEMVTAENLRDKTTTSIKNAKYIIRYFMGNS